jgi:site-specific DNA-methyltransferase (adenine-specific)
VERFIFRDKPGDFRKVAAFAEIYCGDTATTLKGIESDSIDCWVTSPPYFNKLDYGVSGQIGREDQIEDYAYRLQCVGEEMLRCSKDEAVFFMVIGTSWNMSGGIGGDYQDKLGDYKVKVCLGASIEDIPRKADLLVPERVRIAMSEVGWIPRCKIIWNKNDPRRGAKDRPSYSYEEILVFTKTPKHYWDCDAVLQPFSEKSLPQLETHYSGVSKRDYTETGQENPSDSKRRMIGKMKKRPGALLRSVWNIPSGSQPLIETEEYGMVNGLASFPLELSDICVNLGSPEMGVICDPFCGMGTTGVSALRYGRSFVGIELNPAYVEATRIRLEDLKLSKAFISKV